MQFRPTVGQPHLISHPNPWASIEKLFTPAEARVIPATPTCCWTCSKASRLRLVRRFPGAGEALGPRLLLAFGSDRDRYQDAAEMQRFPGVAPVVERGGKSCWVHSRLACPKFLRQTSEFAAYSRFWSPWARAYYDQMRSRNVAHHAAVRALGSNGYVYSTVVGRTTLLTTKTGVNSPSRVEAPLYLSRLPCGRAKGRKNCWRYFLFPVLWKHAQAYRY
jgi:Transposase IS116/IS110/IS902 family